MSADWNSMPVRTTIPMAEIHVWHVDLTAAEAPQEDDLPEEAERKRAARLHPAPVRQRWVAGRWALRRTLARYVGGDPARIELRLGSHGKPALVGSPAPLRFNLSHSGDLALIAVSGQREVGVDVEKATERDVVRLAEIGLAAEDATAVRAAQPGDRSATFHAAWVRRESVAKCLGFGLGKPLPRTPVSVSALDPGEGYFAAVAAAGSSEIRLRHLLCD